MAAEWPVSISMMRRVETEMQIDRAKRGEAAAFAADQRVTNSEGAEFDSSSGRVVLANSHGFVGSYKSSSFSLSVSPIATESGTGAMQRDFWYEVQRKFARLASAESIGQEAARRAVRRLGARKVATKRVPVMFDQETAGSRWRTSAARCPGTVSTSGRHFSSINWDRPSRPIR